MNRPNPFAATKTASDEPTNLLNEARLPRELVLKTAQRLQQNTLRHAGLIREGMQSLQIQATEPAGGVDNAPARVSVFSTDERCHRSPVAILNTLGLTCAHQAAIDLHRLACTVEPVPPLLAAEERFGIAFLAETRENTSAALRLRHSLDLVAAEAASRSQDYSAQRPWLEIVHQTISSFESPAVENLLLPVELLRIRYRGLSSDQVEGLLGDALRALPVLTSGNSERKDVLAITLSGD